MENIKDQNNQLYPELISLGNDLNPFPGQTSTSRAAMTNKYLPNRLWMEGLEPRRIYTGSERECGLRDWGASIEEDCKIIAIIPKIATTFGEDLSFEDSPEKTVVYEYYSQDAVHADCEIVKSHHTDNEFGFKWNVTDVAVNDHLPKGFKLSSTPGMSREGQYCYGLNATVAYMSLPHVTEDGVVISESLKKRMTTMRMGSKVIKWGGDIIPLNIFGDSKKFKAYPDIGEKIRPCGLVAATRRITDDPESCIFSRDDLTQYDPVTDYGVYAKGMGSAVVLDINVIVIKKKGHEDSILTDQVDRYWKLRIDYYRKLISLYYSLKRKNVVIDAELNGLFREAFQYLDMQEGNRLKYTYSKEESEIRVEIIYGLKQEPEVGWKLSNCFGGKSIICHVWPDERMPVDSAGNRADMIMDDVGVVKRLNPSTFYEHMITASARDLVARLRQEHRHWREQWETLMDFYAIVSPLMHKKLATSMTEADQQEHVEEVLKDGIYIWSPTHNPAANIKMIKQLKEKYLPVYGPVTFIGESGRRIRTKAPVLLGENYLMLLNKIGSRWSATTDSVTQQQGILVKSSALYKDRAPIRQVPIRMLAEPDVKIWYSAMGSRAVAELLDRSASPESSKKIIKTILQEDNPSDIKVAVNRDKIPLGGARPNVYVLHMLECAGIKLVDDREDQV